MPRVHNLVKKLGGMGVQRSIEACEMKLFF